MEIIVASFCAIVGAFGGSIFGGSGFGCVRSGIDAIIGPAVVGGSNLPDTTGGLVGFAGAEVTGSGLVTEGAGFVAGCEGTVGAAFSGVVVAGALFRATVSFGVFSILPF